MIWVLHVANRTILVRSTVNLALSYARRGMRAGVLDTDIFGPSIPTLLNLSGEPRLDDSMAQKSPGTRALRG